MIKETTKTFRKFKGGECYIKIGGRTIFSPEEAYKLGSSRTEEFTSRYFHYDTHAEATELWNKLRPKDKDMCWDNEKKVFIVNNDRL